jgi:hypothetical protein
MKLFRLLIFSLILLSGALLQHSPVAAQQQALCFPQNPMIKNCIVSFRQYWELNGGLQIFGYPISAEQPERNAETGRTQVVQWFERNRFEAHPENKAPYDVLLGRLGADRLARMGRNWQAEGRESGPKAGCLWFEQTGHNVCDQDPRGASAADRGFMSYWQTEGLADPQLDAYQRSLALHGLPLTAARMETNASGDTVLTQWFERGRFEWHPNNPRGFRVLLGLLGNEMRGSPATQTLKWFWPAFLPADVSVLRDKSFASETMWMLQLARRGATQPIVTISGGAAGEAPGTKLRDVTIRGQQATLFRGGSGYAVLWSEDGQPYAVLGRTEREVLDIAGGLQQIDRATFEQRLQNAPASRALKYLWPGLDVHELSVWPEPYGGSWANETGFKLNLYRVHSQRPDVTIAGGTAVTRPNNSGGAVSVRGRAGTAYASGADYTVVWIEDGQSYLINSVGSLSLGELLALADKLDTVDLPTFRQRLQPQ